MMREMNPLEADVEEMAQWYVDAVFEAARYLAPKSPWWFVSLSPEQQLWRYLEMRPGIIGWLIDVSSYLPAVKSYDDLMDKLEDIFTGRIEDQVPPELLVDERADALKELVQAAGPKDAAKHIRKMEKMVERRTAANNVLSSARQEALGDLDLEQAMRASTPIPAPEMPY